MRFSKHEETMTFPPTASLLQEQLESVKARWLALTVMAPSLRSYYVLAVSYAKRSWRLLLFQDGSFEQIRGSSKRQMREDISRIGASNGQL